MKLGLKNFTFIDEIKSFPGVEKLVLYGSRARGDCHEKSDIDLCVFGGELTARHILDIEALAKDNDETLLPIDLVHWESLDNQALKANIEKDGKEL